MKKNKFLASSVAAFLALIVCNVAYATVRIDSVSITNVTQAGDTWCWAACAEMAGRCVYTDTDRTQYDVVRYLKGSYDDPYPDENGGTPEESAEGSKYVAYYTANFYATHSTWTFSEIAQSLRNGYAVQTGMGSYSGTERTGGHVVIIHSAQLSYSNGVSQSSVTFCDPLYGTSETCLFDLFCSGSYTQGRIYDQTIYVSG